METTNSNYFGTEKISRILLKIAPPVMLAQLIQALYNIVDSLFVGKYSESGLTALSIIYPLQLLMIAIAVGTGVGINTAMAHYLGVYDEKKATEEAYEANLTKEIIPSYWIDLDKIDTFSDTNTAIKDFFEQQQAQFVCGELDIDNDADWQAYVDGMYSLGLEDWVATQGIEEIAK